MASPGVQLVFLEPTGVIMLFQSAIAEATIKIKFNIQLKLPIPVTLMSFSGEMKAIWCKETFISFSVLHWDLCILK
jgi:hypothetical protein